MQEDRPRGCDYADAGEEVREVVLYSHSNMGQAKRSPTRIIKTLEIFERQNMKYFSLLMLVILFGCQYEAKKNLDAAQKAIDGKDYDLAISFLNETIKSDPKNSEAYYLRGTAYGRKSQFDAAITDYTEAIRLNPNNDNYYRGRSNAYWGKESLNEALLDSTKALKLKPNSAEVYKMRAAIYQSLHDYKNAIDNANSAIKLNPKMSSAYLIRSLSNCRINKLKEAKEDAQKAHELDPNNPELKYEIDLLHEYIQSREELLEK